MLRFGVLDAPDAPFAELAARWRRAEALGLDMLFTADHSHDYRKVGSRWLDGWTVLAAMATATERIRVGTLVSNPILRPPQLLAREALSIDHLSHGRLELGIGAGIARFDHAYMGIDYWSRTERLTRFAEYVQVVDGLLTHVGGHFRHHGQSYRSDSPPLLPRPVQQPRPPITIGGQSDTALRVVAAHGDCWNTHGAFGQTSDQILGHTRMQNRRLDALCVQAGRDPASVRRSLLLFGELDAWTAPDAMEKVVTQFRQAGMTEYIVTWPHDEHLLERAALQVIPRLRED